MPQKRLGVFAPHSLHDLGRFALAAEATRLLSKVLDHIHSDILDLQFHEEARILDRALHALGKIMEFEGAHQMLDVMNQTSICSR